jgi:glutathione S-transferase
MDASGKRSAAQQPRFTEKFELEFVAQVAMRGDGREKYPNLAKFVDRIEARPAYQRAIARSGV